MRSKKPMKKISDASVRELYARKSKKAHQKETATALKDDDLFAVNVAKDGLKKKREKLAADRFKKKNTVGNLKSKTEVALLKKLEKKNPPVPVKKPVEIFDLWGDAPHVGPSKKIQKFMSFSKSSMTRVKPVIVPMQGQSVNPELSSHKEVLKQVIVEEEKQIEEKYIGSMQHALHGANVAMEQLKKAQKAREGKPVEGSDVEDSLSELESSSDEDEENEEEGDKFKIPSHLDRLTKNQRKTKAEKKERNQAQQQKALERRMAKQYDKVQVFINQDKKDTKETAKRIQERNDAVAAEKKQQELTGIVTKAARVGRKSYKMKKTDFQLEDELAGTLREVKPMGRDDFLRDRFDSVYRRNLLDVVDNVYEQEKKRKIKAAFKFKVRSGAMFGGTAAEKLGRKNKKHKEELDMRERKNGFLQDDLILL